MDRLFHTPDPGLRPAARPLTPIARTAIAFVACLFAIVATVELGAWQLRRAAGKEALQARMDASHAMAPVSPDAVALGDPRALVQRHLRFRGRWIPEHVVYLDNRPHDGRTGFYVLMGLRPEAAGAREVIVNRGWLPRDPADRGRIARYETPVGVVEVDGIALADEPRFLELAAPGQRPLGSIWQNFAFDAYAADAGTTPLPIVLRQDPQSAPADGLARDWPDRDGTLQSQIDRHHGYAVQWFSLAAALGAFLLYRLFRIVTHGRTVRS